MKSFNLNLSKESVFLAKLILTVISLLLFFARALSQVFFPSNIIISLFTDAILLIAIVKNMPFNFNITAMVIYFVLPNIVVPGLERALKGFGFFDFLSVSLLVSCLPIILIIAFMILGKYKIQTNLIEKLWFLPAALELVLSLSRLLYPPIFGIVSALIGIADALVLSYWAVFLMGTDSAKDMKNSKEYEYFAKLHAQGAISDAELAKKKAEIEGRK